MRNRSSERFVGLRFSGRGRGADWVLTVAFLAWAGAGTLTGAAGCGGPPATSVNGDAGVQGSGGATGGGGADAATGTGGRLDSGGSTLPATGGTAGGAGSGGSNTSGTGGAGTAGAGGRGSGGSGAGGNGTAGVGAGGASAIRSPWDWVGVVGTGQSLAVGDHGTPVTSTTQPYHNLKLSTGTLPWPVDPNNAALTMVPLVEPIGRLAPTYPSSWPTNIAGETAHSSMGNQITALVQASAGADYVTVQGEVGENGQCMTFLRKGAIPVGVNGHAFAATVIETQAITRLARATGKTYGVGAIIVTHGECDAGNANYETDLYQLWSDYNTDLPAITGQTQKIQMIVSQQDSTSDRSASTLAQWKIGVDHPTDVVCSGPKYQYPYAVDGIHLVTDGYRQLGEKYGQVYFERVVQGHPWQPLQPTTVVRNGRVVTVNFHVPVPPLAWDNTFPAPHQAIAEWSAGKGFEIRSGNTRIAISSVTISGDSVQIACATDLPATGVFVGYALTADPAVRTTPSPGTLRWGQLRDSDPFVGRMTNTPQPNYSVVFELAVP